MRRGWRISTRSFPFLAAARRNRGRADPFSAHGYFGKESETVEQIVNWMLKNHFSRKFDDYS